jgi:hypothetical protein
MTVPLMDRSSKTQKIRILPMVGHDPECQRTKMIKVRWIGFFLGFLGIKSYVSRPRCGGSHL